MSSFQKKTLVIKIKTVDRTYKEYKAYKQQVDNFNINEVSQDKKKGQFYNESKQALQSVKKKLIQYVLDLQAYMAQYQQDINDEADLAADVAKGKNNIEQVRALFPAEM